jgi:pilus assembly protein Flp/PilA
MLNQAIAWDRKSNVSDSASLNESPLSLTQKMIAAGNAKVLRKFVQDESGATAIEYGLIASLIAVAIIGGFSALADAIEKLWGDNNSAIGDALN